MTSKKRYFAFGCSYTNYDWLMVPDLIGVNFPEYYNFGCAGACHTYILNQVVQANEIYNFNAETDYITVGTTGFGRFSRVGVDDSDPTDHKWLVNGDIFPEFDQHPDNARLWAREFDSYQWSVYRSLSALKTIKLILDLKGVEHKIYSSIYNKHLINLEFVPQNNNTIDMIKQFNSLVETDESVDDFLVDYNSKKGLLGIKDIPWVDGHPLVCNSLDYVKKYFPEYNTDVTNLIAHDQTVAMDSFSTRQEYVLHFEQTFLRKYRTDYNQISKIKHHPYYVKA
jgi:hypothetical protein